MTPIIASAVSGVEAVKLTRQGQILLCPVCKSVLKTVPENWQDGMILSGIECPSNFKHYMIHCEDEQATKAMRAKIKELINR